MDELESALAEQSYFADRALSTTLYLGLSLERPVFLEGEPGVGKTEVAKVLAKALGRPLIRLQCYEGIDRQSALYEWNYARQLMHIRLAEAARVGQTAPPEPARRTSRADAATAAASTGSGPEAPFDAQGTTGWTHQLEAELFSPRFLLPRPLLQAVRPEGPAPVLLIDEVDRSDEAFEAFLLELLAEYQVTIPEWGTVQAAEIPVVVLTSNRTREVHDALKRRCLYAWLDYPSFAKECEIVRHKVPGVDAALAGQICAFVARLRQETLFKVPGVAETIYWAQALDALQTRRLTAARIEETLGCLLKYRDDLMMLTQPARQGDAPMLHRLMAEAGVAAEAGMRGDAR
ncbi:MoxR family ATPase [Alicyclobacillus cycloheptanicus]|nr:MoxR family ATPase [Alicyclobacillus cycloheptanicus]